MSKLLFPSSSWQVQLISQFWSTGIIKGLSKNNYARQGRRATFMLAVRCSIVFVKRKKKTTKEKQEKKANGTWMQKTDLRQGWTIPNSTKLDFVIHRTNLVHKGSIITMRQIHPPANRLKTGNILCKTYDTFFVGYNRKHEWPRPILFKTIVA